MKRELEISIRDNWFTDLYPTFCDYLSYETFNMAYRLYGFILGGMFIYGLLNPFFKLARVLELFFYRRKQLDYLK